MVQRDGYEAVDSLVTYYQMVRVLGGREISDWKFLAQETRAPIRLLLLKVFGALCELDHLIISILLASLLPMELARDIRDDLESEAQVMRALKFENVRSIRYSKDTLFGSRLHDGFVNWGSTTSSALRYYTPICCVCLSFLLVG